jgi:hypothetical protein
MMLSELRALLATCPPASDRAAYRKAVVVDNALLKATASNRRKTFLVLRQLYGLDPSILLFRVLREPWDADVDAQPLIAMQCALARDPTLRATIATVLTALEGDAVSPTH